MGNLEAILYTPIFFVKYLASAFPPVRELRPFKQLFDNACCYSRGSLSERVLNSKQIFKNVLRGRW